MNRISIDPITRLEGHGTIDIFLDDDGDVADAYFQVVELRGFEKFCEGRPVEELIRIMPKICGVCPGAHHMAAAKAADAVYDTGLARAHRQHLADAARLEARRHQEQVAAAVEQVAEFLRVTAQEDEVGVVRGDACQLLLVVALAAAEHHEHAATVEGATAYYIERVEQIGAMASELRNGFFYLDAECLVDDTNSTPV